MNDDEGEGETTVYFDAEEGTFVDEDGGEVRVDVEGEEEEDGEDEDEEDEEQEGESAAAGAGDRAREHTITSRSWV